MLSPGSIHAQSKISHNYWFQIIRDSSIFPCSPNGRNVVDQKRFHHHDRYHLFCVYGVWSILDNPQPIWSSFQGKRMTIGQE